MNAVPEYKALVTSTQPGRFMVSLVEHPDVRTEGGLGLFDMRLRLLVAEKMHGGDRLAFDLVYVDIADGVLMRSQAVSQAVGPVAAGGVLTVGANRVHWGRQISDWVRARAGVDPADEQLALIAELHAVNDQDACVQCGTHSVCQTQLTLTMHFVRRGRPKTR